MSRQFPTTKNYGARNVSSAGDEEFWTIISFFLWLFLSINFFPSICITPLSLPCQRLSFSSVPSSQLFSPQAYQSVHELWWVLLRAFLKVAEFQFTKWDFLISFSLFSRVHNMEIFQFYLWPGYMKNVWLPNLFLIQYVNLKSNVTLMIFQQLKFILGYKNQGPTLKVYGLKVWSLM